MQYSTLAAIFLSHMCRAIFCQLIFIVIVSLANFCLFCHLIFPQGNIWASTAMLDIMANYIVSHVTWLQQMKPPCGLQGCKNRPALFLARCRTRPLNQALSILSLSLDFLSVSVVLLTGAAFCVVLLHCMLNLATQYIVIGPVCGFVCVCGSVTTITPNCVHRSSPNWVCR